MKKSVIAMILLVAVVLGAMAGCSKKGITAEEAQEIVIEHLGAHKRQVSDMHVHIEENDEGVVCYNIHITVKDVTYTCLVHSITGEVLSVEEGGGH